MDLFVQRVIDGLGDGSIYAALALALVLVFRSSGTVNFAQGELAMLSTYGVWLLVSIGFNIWLALALAVIVSFLAGAGLERGLIRIVPRGDHLVMVIVMIGLYTLLNSIGLWLFKSDPRELPSLFPVGNITLSGVVIPFDTLGAVATLAVISVGLWALFNHTKLGLGLRAVAENTESGKLAGLPTSRLLAVGWGLAASLGAIAGALVTSLGLFLQPAMMLPVLVYAMASATLGGFDSPIGAIVAGLALGVAGSLITGYVPFIGTDLSLAVPVIVMLVVMLAKPAGLFGSVKVVRA
ncbi:branched-chain amino acid ABC transporter permease [Microbacterium immunditiarum]|uniref:Branched-chain amino acid transport system permease protein n=1 Tax=Microbacterium immunditiarum TaxID=337480 RepID=A0A7Y9GRV8_9MICO|nr:branched-chain amino acid ABC transporter permease [Microbacterium immunditiarum]NYE21542.1 branched-chain amino acid transport system permease protein [Microbacterium immunditiarum]